MCRLVSKCQLKFKPTIPNPIEYNYGPQSVALADFNNDTWLDMVVANQVVNNIAIYLGKSGGLFSSPRKYSTGIGSAPYMVATGDFDNDYGPDIAVANFGTNNILLFLGFHNSSFASQIELSTGTSRPIAITLADFNHDTQLDIATANYGKHSVSVFYGYGNGSFSNPQTYSTAYDSLPLSLVAGDFNNDNHIDLAIANYGTNNVGILFGNGDGTFANQIIFSTSLGSHPHSLATGYFNDDIFLDLAVANSGTNNIGILVNNGNGTFANQTTYTLDLASPYSISVSDLNQDNRLDLVVTNKGTNNIDVLLGAGNGAFKISKTYSTGSISSIALALGDLNKDRRMDVIVISNDTGAIDVLLGTYEGFSDQARYQTGLVRTL